MKTLEETRKALDGCLQCTGCYGCPYDEDPLPRDMVCPNAVRDALDHIKQLESQIPRWIPVEERLPEKHAGVIACCEDGFVDLMTHDGRHWNWNGRYEDSVTHWMPMPEPPSEKKGE